MLHSTQGQQPQEETPMEQRPLPLECPLISSAQEPPLKKKYSLVSATKTIERQADSIKHDIKKVFQKLNRRKLQDKSSYWHFTCKIEPKGSPAQEISPNGINAMVDELVVKGVEEFTLEVEASTRQRQQKK